MDGPPKVHQWFKVGQLLVHQCQGGTNARFHLTACHLYHSNLLSGEPNRLKSSAQKKHIDVHKDMDDPRQRMSAG